MIGRMQSTVDIANELGIRLSKLLEQIKNSRRNSIIDDIHAIVELSNIDYMLKGGGDKNDQGNST